MVPNVRDYLDVSRVSLGARDRAIAVHSSQTSPYDGLPDDLRRAFLGRDHLKRVRPAWTGGPLETELAGLG